MNFRFTKWKAIFSVVVIVSWYILLFWFSSSVRCNYDQCPSTFKASDCEEVFVFNIIPETCGGGCVCPEPTPISSIFAQLIIILFPGILGYLIWSIFQKK